MTRVADYDGVLTKFLVLFAVACSNSGDKQPAPADPWATPTGSDPWAAAPSPDPSPPAAAEPEPAKPRSASADGPSTLAGTYQCQTLRYGTLVNGMYQTAYVPSALGTFEIDPDGAYRSASYPDKGSGRTHAEAAAVAFEDGPYAGYLGEVGETSSGAYIRFGADLSAAPTPTMHFNDHVCYRR